MPTSVTIKFETEYTAMKEVSQCLSEVKVTFLKLHPIEGGTELIGTERTESIASLGKAIGKYREKLEEWAVFLEPPPYVSSSTAMQEQMQN